MSTSNPTDRFFSLDTALAIAQDEANKNQIEFEFTIVTQVICPTLDINTIVCQIKSHKNQLRFTGGGSGNLRQAQIKSLYEALEETLTYQSLNKENNPIIQFFSSSNSPSMKFLKQHELLPSFLLQEKCVNKEIPWLQLKSSKSTDADAFYPLGLVYPYTHKIPQFNKIIEENKLTEISNGTGIAIGANQQEAIIHGIYEWIERDCYSIFLLNTLIKKSKKAIFVTKHTLPIHIRNIITAIEKKYNDEIIIVDICSDLAIPSFLVSFTRQPVMVQPSGLGASLCKDAALEQALLEALQARDRYNQNTVQVREESIKHYQNYPLLAKSIKCDLTEIQRKNQFTNVSWSEVSTRDVSLNIEDPLIHIQNLLNIKNHDIYYSILHESDNGLTLAYVLVTGMETFSLIREGIFVPLKKRGREVLA